MLLKAVYLIQNQTHISDKELSASDLYLIW